MCAVVAAGDKYGRAFSVESRARCYEAASSLLRENKHINISAALRDVLYRFGFVDVTDWDLYALFPEYSQTLFRRYVELIRCGQFLPKKPTGHVGELWLTNFGGVFTQLRCWYLEYQAKCLRALLVK